MALWTSILSRIIKETVWYTRLNVRPIRMTSPYTILYVKK